MPFDHRLVHESVRRTRRAIVVGEGPRFLDLGAEVSASIHERLFHVLDSPVLRLGGRHAPIPHSPTLFESIIPQEADIERAVLAVVAETRRPPGVASATGPRQ
jgi:pyruvate/2-oxoglutarate/acetoin dehydrogenase E1 component